MQSSSKVSLKAKAVCKDYECSAGYEKLALDDEVCLGDACSDDDCCEKVLDPPPEEEGKDNVDDE